MKSKDYIVTIDFGTQKIIGVAGRVSTIGTIEILAKEEELSNGAIRRGVIIRPEDVELAVKNIVARLNQKLNDKGYPKINDVFACLSGDSFRSEVFETTRYLSGDELTKEDLESLIEEGLTHKSQMGIVVNACNLEYKLDQQIVSSPISKSGDELHSTQLLLVAMSRLIAPIQEVFDRISTIHLAGIIPSPICNSSLLLTEAERQLGSILIDFGAGVTSLSIFGKGRLEYFFTLPFGGNCVTQDLMSLDVSFHEAERLKRRSSKALMSHEDTKIKIPTIRNHTSEAFQIESIRLNALVEARMTEIIQNLKRRLDNNNVFGNNFSEGIVICGGGSQLSDLQVLIKKFFGMDVRKASVSKHLSSDTIEGYNLQLEHATAIGGILCANQFATKEESMSDESSINEVSHNKGKPTSINEPNLFNYLVEKSEEQEAISVGIDSSSIIDSPKSNQNTQQKKKIEVPIKPKVSIFNRIKQALNEDNNEMQ